MAFVEFRLLTKYIPLKSANQNPPSISLSSVISFVEPVFVKSMLEDKRINNKNSGKLLFTHPGHFNIYLLDIKMLN